MIIDWTAMGYVFGDTAQQYFERNKKTIQLPEHIVKFMYTVFDELSK